MKRRNCGQGFGIGYSKEMNLGKFRRTWEHNIKIHLKGMAYGGTIVMNLD
jgi:hypothetical protein